MNLLVWPAFLIKVGTMRSTLMSIPFFKFENRTYMVSNAFFDKEERNELPSSISSWMIECWCGSVLVKNCGWVLENSLTCWTAYNCFSQSSCFRISNATRFQIVSGDSFFTLWGVFEASSWDFKDNWCVVAAPLLSERARGGTFFDYGALEDPDE